MATVPLCLKRRSRRLLAQIRWEKQSWGLVAGAENVACKIMIPWYQNVSHRKSLNTLALQRFLLNQHGTRAYHLSFLVLVHMLLIFEGKVKVEAIGKEVKAHHLSSFGHKGQPCFYTGSLIFKGQSCFQRGSLAFLLHLSDKQIK